MSQAIHDQIKVLKKRGVPDTDPRVVGLKRRLEANDAAKTQAAEVAEQLRNMLVKEQ